MGFHLSHRFCILSRRDAELFLKLPGEVVNCGILQFCRDLRKVQVVFPDHLLALLELDPADILAGRDLQILVEQGRQIAGAHIHLPGHQRHGQLFPDVRGDILLGLPDDLILAVDRVGGLQLAGPGFLILPQQ